MPTDGKRVCHICTHGMWPSRNPSVQEDCIDSKEEPLRRELLKGRELSADDNNVEVKGYRNLLE